MNTIEAVRSSLEAELEHQRPEIPNLNLKNSAWLLLNKLTNRVSQSR